MRNTGSEPILSGKGTPRPTGLSPWAKKLSHDDSLKAQVRNDAIRVEQGLAPEGDEIDLEARIQDLRDELDAG